jgi:glyceraldehyde 3-phosphate dehydrogenase
MKIRVAINGFGRIGRGAFKVALTRDDIEIVAINDLASAKTLANLLKHDSVYGAYDHPVTFDDNNIIVGNLPIKVFNQPDPVSLPWASLNVQVVIEATGQFTEPAKAKAHITAGAKKAILTASTPGEDVTTIIVGVNEEKIKDAGSIICTGGATATCIAPVLEIMDQHFGLQKAMTTTAHSYTAEQKSVDGVAKDFRSARAAAHNIVPSVNRTSIASTRAFEKLAGKLENLCIKVPTLAVSLADFTVVVSKNVTVQEVNEAFKKAAAEAYYQGILAVSDEDLVSSDFIGNSHSAIIDSQLTKVVDGNLVKVVAWFDNEWGYCNRLVELVADVGKALPAAAPSQTPPVVEAMPPAPEPTPAKINVVQE